MMEATTPWMLDVWRAIGRHLELAEATARSLLHLRSWLPVDRLVIRRLDATRSLVETVASSSRALGGTKESGKSVCSATELDQLVLWCRRGQVRCGRADDLRREVPALLPDDLDGDMLVGPLQTETGPVGLLLLQASAHAHFDETHAAIAQTLLEPFTVALENDRRLHELLVLREAAEAENRSLLVRLGRHDLSDSIVGAETGLRQVLEHVALVARADAPVLILGETGSGKEVIARAIHNQSRRAAGPFQRVNCGAIPPELVDSELFGHERGSFTGAVRGRKGWFERADGGTLFLDECGELPLAAQVRLLRILQDGLVERVGGEKPQHVDVRIVAATHRDLPAMVRAGQFREDLWYRIAVFPVRLPPLRERREDIAALAGHFAVRAAQRLGSPPLVPSPADIQRLMAYGWPGNVRELAAVIERAVILGSGKRLEVAQALGSAQPAPLEPTGARLLVPETAADFPTLDQSAARHMEAALKRTQGRIEGPEGAARLLDINPHTLRARMRKLGVVWQRFRVPVLLPMHAAEHRRSA